VRRASGRSERAGGHIDNPVCDMQSEDKKVQCIIWREFNNLMKKNSVENTNFKGFMADSAQAN
jgi:hypothetical protein